MRKYSFPITRGREALVPGKPSFIVVLQRRYPILCIEHLLPAVLLSRQWNMSLPGHFQQLCSVHHSEKCKASCQTSLVVLRTIMREQQVLTYKIGNMDFSMVIGSYLSSNICKKLFFWMIQQAPLRFPHLLSVSQGVLRELIPWIFRQNNYIFNKQAEKSQLSARGQRGSTNDFQKNTRNHKLCGLSIKCLR